MNRPDSSDLDVSDWIAGPYGRNNATCSQCGTEFCKGREDTGSLCDKCCYDRDLKAEDERLNRAAYAVHGAMQDFDQAITKASTIAQCITIRRRLAELVTIVDRTERKALQHADEIGKAS